MKVGLQLPWFDWPGSRPSDLRGAIRDAAQGAEAAGFSSLWVMDHFFPIEFEAPPFPRAGRVDEPMLEAFAVLNFCAAITDSISLGPLVAGAFYRHPALLIKAATALDVLSGGRSYLGIGAGWYRREALGLGLPFPTRDERFRILEETVQIARHMWSGDRSPFRGERFTLAEPINEPPPISQPHPPILIGGGGERRTLRLVAEYADACNLYFGAGPSEYEESLSEIAHKIDVLRRHCDDVGRDVGEIEVTALGSIHLASEAMSASDVRSLLRRVRDAGVDHAIVNMPNAFDPAVLESLGRDVLPDLAS